MAESDLGKVTGFGPLNATVDAVISQAVDRAMEGFYARGIPAMTEAARTQLVPALLKNTDLQQTIGAAAGAEAAERLKVPMYIAAGALAVAALTGVALVVRSARRDA